LEYSLPLLSAKRETHKALARAYQNLGLLDLAAEHERLAKALAAEKTPTVRTLDQQK
jgi:hypothetical protein